MIFFLTFETSSIKKHNFFILKHSGAQYGSERTPMILGLNAHSFRKF